MDDSRDGSYALVALARVPHLHEVGTRGERQARVFTEAYVVDVVGVVTERQHLLAARQVPNFRRLVCAKRKHHVTSHNRAFMTQTRMHTYMYT